MRKLDGLSICALCFNHKYNTLKQFPVDGKSYIDIKFDIVKNTFRMFLPFYIEIEFDKRDLRLSHNDFILKHIRNNIYF